MTGKIPIPITVLIRFQWPTFNSIATDMKQLACMFMRQRAYVEIIWARGKFGEHERGVRVARGAAESNSSLLSALQTSQVLNISTYAQLQHELIVL